MWKRLRRKAEKAIEKKKAELEKKEVSESKKEPGKKVEVAEWEKADKAMGRLRTFVPKVLPVPPSVEGKPVIEVYDERDAYSDIKMILQYLMEKQENK